jgi:hypothetical protein
VLSGAGLLSCVAAPPDLYTNEIYPADVRATGMGMSSAVARVGLISTPFVAQWLDSINLTMAMAVYGLAASGAVWALWTLPIETTGREMLGTMDELMHMLQQRACTLLSCSLRSYPPSPALLSYTSRLPG